MHWLFDLEDLDEVWKAATEMAEARGDFIARPENLDLINANLKEQGGDSPVSEGEDENRVSPVFSPY